jgi:hypothetical protein
MKNNIAFFLIYLLCSCFCYPQTVSFTLNNSNSIGALTPEMLEECKPEIEKKLNKLCDAIEYIGSYDQRISPIQKRHRRDEIKSLFFRFEEHYMTITSRATPQGRKMKLRDFINHLITQSYRENQSIYKIEKVDVTLTSDKKNIPDPNVWHLVAKYEDGTEVYEAPSMYNQVYYVKSRHIRIGNLETHEPSQIHYRMDDDTKIGRVYLIQSPKTEGNGYNVLIRLRDIYASILE